MKKYEEIECTAPCEETGENCELHKVELLAENALAWEVYWDARSPVAAVLRELRSVDLTEYEADVLAIKVRALAGKVALLESEREKRDADRLRNQR